MNRIADFLHSSRVRLEEVQALLRGMTAVSLQAGNVICPASLPSDAVSDTDATDAAALPEDDFDLDAIMTECQQAQTANAAELEAAILYLQNRYTPLDLVETDTEDADFLPANDVYAEDVAALMTGDETAVVASVGAGAPPCPVIPAGAKDAHRFGCSETSLFHAGQDWIALDDLRVEKVPAA